MAWFIESKPQNTIEMSYNTRFHNLFKHLHDEKIYSLNAEEAATICGVTRPHFMNSFKKQFHINYNDFLIQRKMAYAKELLLNSDQNSADIALELGFEDPSYFVKVFKKVTDMTPKQFRIG